MLLLPFKQTKLFTFEAKLHTSNIIMLKANLVKLAMNINILNQTLAATLRRPASTSNLGKSTLNCPNAGHIKFDGF